MEQFSSVDEQQIDDADVDNEGQPDNEHPAAQTGENGRDEKVERVGLDVAAQLFAA